MTAPYTPTFAEKVKFGKKDSIMTYYGKNGLGEQFFCYIRCGLDGYKKMQEDFASKAFAAPESYGEIIYKDYILEPDNKAVDFLKNWLAENNGNLAE